AVAAAVVLTPAAAAPAHAAGYRYWSFWESDGTGKWAYATQGPATARPADGDVIGFRFAVSEDANDAAQPSAAPDFAAICAGTEKAEKKAGTKRVAVVIDFGGPLDAPPGETPPDKLLKAGCPRVREDATSAEALAAVAAPLRYDSAALLCGIAGYPAKGCGDQVAGTSPRPSGSERSTGQPTATVTTRADGESGGPSVGALAGGVAVLALGGAAVWKARRRG
ncbi:SCO2322 family protein, partial [Streptomyces lateritius]|uniref:SCO2322 family protein n=1 Tax=Streptomyces lateritius TaxID=67313 RepID=UPI00167C030F